MGYLVLWDHACNFKCNKGLSIPLKMLEYGFDDTNIQNYLYYRYFNIKQILWGMNRTDRTLNYLRYSMQWKTRHFDLQPLQPGSIYILQSLKVAHYLSPGSLYLPEKHWSSYSMYIQLFSSWWWEDSRKERSGFIRGFCFCGVVFSGWTDRTGQMRNGMPLRCRGCRWNALFAG